MAHMVMPCCVQHAAFVAICMFLTVPELTACFRDTEHRTLHSINVSVTSAGALLLDWGVLGSKKTILTAMMVVACTRLGQRSSPWPSEP